MQAQNTEMWLDRIPAGVILINEQGVIHHFNTFAGEILSLSLNETWSEVLKLNIKNISEEGDYLQLHNNKTISLRTQSLDNKKGQLILIVEKKIKKTNIVNNIVFGDSKTKQILEMALQVAKSDAFVLIQGESGTGKEVFARFIHENSSRKDAPFIAINCAAIPDNMLEAMLFGYEKGAYTGAYQASEGKFEQANGGTMLLDEISEMPSPLQAKLLRVLQEREVERLGGKKSIKLDIRIIATTNRQLSKEVEQGNFRKDLYFRLSVFPLTILPLRERKDDIVPLAKYMIDCYRGNLDIKIELSKSAEQKLITHIWTGNVRELQNVIQRAMTYCKKCIIEEEHILFDNQEKTDEITLPESLNDQLISKENNLILNTLSLCDGNRNLAAQKLGISTRTLRYKLSRIKKSGSVVSEDDL